MIREWNVSTYKRFIKEGRGQGSGKDYKPWIHVHDISSRGRSTRIYSHTTQRVMHLLSDLQLFYYYLLEFDPIVVDIREQYPLLDLLDMNVTLDESLMKKVYHSKSGIPRIFTTSFVVTRKTDHSDVDYEARVIKTSTELKSKAVIDRMEIQRRFYDQKNIDFGVITEKEIPINLARNVGWYLSDYDISGHQQLQVHYDLIRHDLLQLLLNKNTTFQQAFDYLERGYQLDTGLGLTMFKHLVATHQIKIDLSVDFDSHESTHHYNIQIGETELKKGGNHFASGGE